MVMRKGVQLIGSKNDETWSKEQEEGKVCSVVICRPFLWKGWLLYVILVQQLAILSSIKFVYFNVFTPTRYKRGSHEEDKRGGEKL